MPLSLRKRVRAAIFPHGDLSAQSSVWTATSSCGFWHNVGCKCVSYFLRQTFQAAPNCLLFLKLSCYLILISSWSAWQCPAKKPHKYYLNSLIFHTWSLFSDFLKMSTLCNTLLPRMAVHVFSQKVSSLLILRKGFFLIRCTNNVNDLISCLPVCIGSAFVKVWRSCRGCFQEETPSCMRAFRGWAASWFNFELAWHLF